MLRNNLSQDISFVAIARSSLDSIIVTDDRLRSEQEIYPEWVEENNWTGSNNNSINLIHVHQDQVTKLPRGAELIGTASHCKNAAFIIDDTVFAVQGHPEFDAPYTDALVGLLKDRAGESHVKAARKSLSTPHDGMRVANWILAFFARHKPAH